MEDAQPIWKQAILPFDATIRDVIQCLNNAGTKIVLVIDRNGQLRGSVSDGDVRRGLLRGLTVESPASEIANLNPLVVPQGTSREMVKALMVANKVQQVPIVDVEGCPAGLHLWDEIDAQPERDNLMVIMAGGKGRRLLPHTENCPKPMLPVAGKPILEHIIGRASQQGFSRFVLSLNYLGDMIRDHFGDGSRLGVSIDYVLEEEPLGTAGSLSLLSPRPDMPFVVTNGDVLADINYGDLIDFQARHNAAAVMSVRLYEWTNPFGVVHMDGVNITGFEEKPVSRSHINAGVYTFAPEALDFLEARQHCDMPALFDRLRTQGKSTIAYPMHEPWLDVGRPADLEQANRNILPNS